MTEQAFDLNALLDGTLDDLADRPEFRPFVAGTHRLSLSVEQDKEVKTVYWTNIKLLETLQQVDPTEAPMEIGTGAKIRLDLSNKYGQGDLKMILKAVAGTLGTTNPRELLEALKTPVEVAGVTGLRVNKETKAVYTTLEAVEAL